jgi:hypothetical protein
MIVHRRKYSKNTCKAGAVYIESTLLSNIIVSLTYINQEGGMDISNMSQAISYSVLTTNTFKDVQSKAGLTTPVES